MCRRSAARRVPRRSALAVTESVLFRSCVSVCRSRRRHRNLRLHWDLAAGAVGAGSLVVLGLVFGRSSSRDGQAATRLPGQRPSLAFRFHVTGDDDQEPEHNDANDNANHCAQSITAKAEKRPEENNTRCDHAGDGATNCNHFVGKIHEAEHEHGRRCEHAQGAEQKMLATKCHARGTGLMTESGPRRAGNR